MVQRLVLVPTERERQHVVSRLGAGPGTAVRVELCGFGPVAAAARTALLVAEHRPAEVVLVGIAGGFDDLAAMGTAWEFARVGIHGVGAGTGAEFTPAAALGWLQWPGDPGDARTEVGDLAECGPRAVGGLPTAPLLLTACAAADGAADVAARKRLYPDAWAEDMEGFGVAMACRLHGVPCRLLRGISNRAGDRDQARWNVAAALDAVADLLLRLLASPP